MFQTLSSSLIDRLVFYLAALIFRSGLLTWDLLLVPFQSQLINLLFWQLHLGWNVFRHFLTSLIHLLLPSAGIHQESDVL